MSKPRPPFDALLLCERNRSEPMRPLSRLYPIGPGMFIGRLSDELETKILKAWCISTPYIEGCGDEPVYAFICERRQGAESETRLVRAMYLASLLKPTLVSLRYGATVHPSGSVDAWGRWDPYYEGGYLAGKGPRWLRSSDISAFRRLVASDLAIHRTGALRGTPVGRALSAFAALQHTYNFNHRLVSAVSIVEGLVSKKGDASSRVFEHRVPGLARLVGARAFSRKTAAAA